MRETGFDKDGKRISISKICFHCKSKLTLNRYEDNDIVYFDGHFYHTQCFANMASVKKKCTCCGEDIIINSVNDPLIYYDSKFYHVECFDNVCESKSTKKWKTASLYRNDYIDEAKEKIKILFSKKNANLNNLDEYANAAKGEIQKIWDESDMNYFLIETYNIHTIGNIYTKYLAPIYTGTYYKSPGVTIPPRVLLDMWKRKLTYLSKAREKKIRSGADMNGMQKVAYDFAIVISKYDSYLEWKEQQQVLESKQIDIQKNILKNVDLQNVGKQINKNKENNREDIDILLEEMF